MKIPVPADLDEEAAINYMTTYWRAWKDYKEHGRKNEQSREPFPAAYDQGFGDSLRSSMNWTGRKR